MKDVLVIDDDKYFTDDIKMFFEFDGLGCQIISDAGGYYENINKIDSYKCVVLDIMMRKPITISDIGDMETGEYLFEQIRKDSKSIPIIIATAKKQNDLNINFDDKKTLYKKKPVQVLELIKLIEELQ